MSDFERNLSLINELVALSERMAGAGRASTTVAELSERLRRPLSDVIRVFEILGVQPGGWSEPSTYLLSAIIESGTRHEVARRA